MRRVACIALPEIRVEIARAKSDELRVRVAEDTMRAALIRIAEAGLAFGPATAFDVAQEVVWVEVGGCAHLHGGEDRLARALYARVHALGHTCRIAIADGPRIASAVARFAPARKAGPLIVPEGRGGAAMRVLPVAALGIDDEACAWLEDLGLPSCGHLQKLPRRALGIRLGARVHDVMQLLDGEDRAPLDAWRPPEVPEERIELEWGVHSIEALAFVIKSLCDRLAARLRGRAMAAARLELVLGLDRALCEGNPHGSTLEVVMPVPIAHAADLLAVVRARLERHWLAAPVLSATLRVPELARVTARSLDMLAPEPKADRALPRLVAELSAELGLARVGTLSLVDTWVPDERTRLLPFGMPLSTPRHPLATSALEPSRLVDPVRIPHEAFVDARLLARIEAVEWWRYGTSARDLVAAWIGSGREGAHAWVELQEDESRLRGWID